MISYNTITNKAIQIGPPSFKASSGWFEKFKRRNKIGVRIGTNICQKLKDDSYIKIIEFIENISSFRSKFLSRNRREPIFINFDETPVYLDSRRNRTYDMQGLKSIPIKKCANYKTRFTATLAVSSHGEKLPSLIVIKNRSSTYYKFFKGGMVTNNSKGWISLEALIRWFEDCLLNSKTKFDAVIFDECSVHLRS